MKLINKNVKRQLTDSIDIEGTFEVFLRILEDMKLNAGKMTPAENWDIAIGGHHGGDYFKGNKIKQYENLTDLYNARYSTLGKMLDPWIGCVGMQPISEQTIKEYLPFLKIIDQLDIVSTYVNNDETLTENGKSLLNTDLGSIIDVNLINLFTKSLDSLRILEVGGGYGRLAEAFFEAYGPKQIKYVLVDSVPASIMYSYYYLLKRFPELRIGFYYNGDDFDLTKYDCYIVPSWHFEKVNNLSYDVCCNVQSMQEMNQFHVDYYLDLFDRLINPHGIVYLSNEKDYVFKGKWNYPNRWINLLKTRTPRSWTRNSPTEVFGLEQLADKKGEAFEILYKLQLLEFDKTQKINLELKNKLAGLNDFDFVTSPSINSTKIDRIIALIKRKLGLSNSGK